MTISNHYLELMVQAEQATNHKEARKLINEATKLFELFDVGPDPPVCCRSLPESWDQSLRSIAAQGSSVHVFVFIGTVQITLTSFH